MNNRRNILLLGGAVLVVLFVIALFSLGKQGSEGTTNAPVNLMNNTSDDSIVTFIEEGPVEADELHTTLTIEVSASSRSIELDQTYQNQPVGVQTYSNNQAAYDDFLQALQYANFTKPRKGKTTASELGMCPLGDRYIYELATDGQSNLRLWSDSCGDRTATFDGEASLVHELFERQIPHYDEVVDSISKP
jgi:hypothetical protein